MKLRNGTQEDQAVVAAVMSSLHDLRQDHATEGLKIARRVALGSGAQGAARMLADYGLVRQGKMSQSARNVILSAVTASGELQNPVA